MNDRFLFRVWYKQGKKFFYGIFPGAQSLPNTRNTRAFVLEQCTGLKDKNRRLIYEGDIIAINTHFDFIVSDDYEYKNKSEKGTAYYKVYFDTQKSGFKMALVSFTKEKPRCVVCDVMAWHQVVGNIHETPELLED